MRRGVVDRRPIEVNAPKALRIKDERGTAKETPKASDVLQVFIAQRRVAAAAAVIGAPRHGLLVAAAQAGSTQLRPCYQ